MSGPLFRRTTLDACSKLQRRTWHLVDAEDQVVGRLASSIAHVLMGKHRPDFRRDLARGDTVVVINAEKVQFTGNKWKEKLYRKHSQYPGGLKEIPAWRKRERHPAEIIQKAVKGMMPKNPTRHLLMSKLKVYTGDEHPHEAQFKLRVRRDKPESIPMELQEPDEPHLQELDRYWRKKEREKWGEELPIV